MSLSFSRGVCTTKPFTATVNAPITPQEFSMFYLSHIVIERAKLPLARVCHTKGINERFLKTPYVILDVYGLTIPNDLVGVSMNHSLVLRYHRPNRRRLREKNERLEKEMIRCSGPDKTTSDQWCSSRQDGKSRRDLSRKSRRKPRNILVGRALGDHCMMGWWFGGVSELRKSFGILVDGQEIAVKTLSRSSWQGVLEFINEAWTTWKDGKALELIDPNMKESCVISEVLRCLHISLLCVQQYPEDRPIMTSIILMLESHMKLVEPKEHGFIPRNVQVEEDLCSNKKDTSLSNDKLLTMEEKEEEEDDDEEEEEGDNYEEDDEVQQMEW
ncbi:hypothetical protein Fmac_021316 [Flemingia macrophylla]|uniref:Uncharacterized protein n=1 Tax=Flemingia macrophylla TaxID=520843 RepID=A0ABD1LWH4_9FABA